MSHRVLAIEDVSVSIANRRIVKRVSFHVEQGERLTIIGPNGAGKTTLLRCLGRLLLPDSGRVLLHGKPLSGYGHRALARQLCYVPQAQECALPYTVYEFLLMARYPHLGPFSTLGRSDHAAVKRALAQTDMAAFGGRMLDTLSGGERQKVFIAAALAQEAPLLLLDEPTAFLDYRHQVEVAELLLQLQREEGKTVVCVTHDLNCGVYWSDRVLALKQGEGMYFGGAEGLYARETLLSIYDTPFDVLPHAQGGGVLVAPLTREQGGKPHAF